MASTTSLRGARRSGQNGAALRHAFDTLREDVAEIGDDVMALADAVKDEVKIRADTAGKMAQSRGAAVYDDARERVQERPMAALGIAAGVGVLLGMILMGGRR